MLARGSLVSRLFRLHLAAVLLFVWSGATRIGRAEEGTPGSGVTAVEYLERCFRAVEATAREIPRDTFDPRAVVDEVGGDPDRIFAWVRDRTDWVPYRGALRGPVGVLMDRLGNALDRSLLLAELLRAAGQEVRLARVALSESRATDLLGGIRPPRAGPLPEAPGGVALREALAERARRSGLDAQAMALEAEKARARAERAAEEMARRVAEHVPRLVAAIGESVGREDPTALAVSALRDHWWVQRRDGGRWIDMDPLLPRAVPGEALGPPAATMGLGRQDGRIHLESVDCHEVTIRVVAEQTKGGARLEHVLLDHVLRPAERIGEPVGLSHSPLGWPADIDLATEKGRTARLKEAVLAREEWLPVLTVGRERIASCSVTVTGEKRKKPGQAGAGEVGEGVRSGFGGFGGGRRSEPGPKGVWSAEWLEFEIRSPGEPARTIRREVFDLVGPAARAATDVADPVVDESRRFDRGLALLGRIDSLPTACRLSPGFVAHWMAARILDGRVKTVAAAGQERRIGRARVAALLDGLIPGGASALYGLALSRFEDSPVAAHVFLDRTNILDFHVTPRVGPKGAITARVLFDLVASGIAVRRSPGVDPFRVRLEQGVVDAAAEGVALSGTGSTECTTEVFERAAARGAGCRVVREAGAAELAALSPDVDARARIERALAAGHTVVLPGSPEGDSPGGWWRVDPRTGETVGVLDSGFHGAMLEYLRVQKYLDYITAIAGPGQPAHAALVIVVRRFMAVIFVLLAVIGVLVGVIVYQASDSDDEPPPQPRPRYTEG